MPKQILFFSSTFGTLAERLSLRRYDKAQTLRDCLVDDPTHVCCRCRFSDAGNDETLRTLQPKRGLQKAAIGTEVAGSWAPAGSERYGDYASIAR